MMEAGNVSSIVCECVFSVGTWGCAGLGRLCRIKKRLLGVAGPLWLQYRGAGGDNSGLTRRMDGLELKLRAHPESPVRAGVSYNLHL